MSTLFSDTTQFPWAAPFTGGEEFCAGDPCINPALLWAPTGDLTLETTVGEKQEWTSFHHSNEPPLSPQFYHPRAQMEAFFACDQIGPQPNLSIHEAPPYGAGGGCGNGNVNRKARTAGAVCPKCNRSFRRVQELARHRKDVHEQPRHCLFCGVKWTRPSNIKAHLLARHREKFTAELLVTIQALRGRMIVAFLDKYDQGSGVTVEAFPLRPEQFAWGVS